MRVRLLLLPALAVLALLSAGCGGGGGGATASSGDISRAAQKTARAGSLEAEFALSGGSLKGDGSGVFNTGKGASGQLTMTVTVSGRQIPVDTIITGNVFYMRSPALTQRLAEGKQWIKVDLGKIARQGGPDVGALFSSPTPVNALAYLIGTSTVEKVGSDSVGGVDTTHYRVTVDLRRAEKRARGTLREVVKRVLARGGIAKLPLEVWVDDRDYIRRVIYDETAPGQRPTRVKMDLHDFRAHVPITPPPSNSVVDFNDALGGGG
jgi:hypothetical protein